MSQMDALVVSYLEWRAKDEEVEDTIPSANTANRPCVVVEELDIFCESCGCFPSLLVVLFVNRQIEPQRPIT